MLRTLAKYRNFRNFWCGQTVSLVGTAVTDIAVPLTAAVVLNASALQMGILGALEWIPWLAVGLFAGVWVDRMPGKWILIVTDVIRGVVLLSVPVAVWLGLLTMNLLLVVVLVVGLATVFFQTSSSALVPRVVPNDALLEATSAALTAPVAILLDAVSYFVSVLFLRRISVADEAPEDSDGTAERALRREIGEGFAAIASNPLVRPAVLGMALTSIGNGVFIAVYIPFLVRDLALAPGVVALPFLVMGVFAILGALATAAVTRRFGFGPTLVASGLVNGLATLAIPFAEKSPLVLVAVLAPWVVSGFITPIFGSTVQTLIQTTTPQALMGRVSSTSNFLTWGLMPIGSLLGGLVATHLSNAHTLLLNSGFYLIAPVLLMTASVLRLREPPQQAGAEVSDEPPATN